MTNRDLRQWAARQRSGNVKPFPAWLRYSIIGGAIVFILGKLAGLI